MSTEVIAAMIGAARLAPSLHNSQPWRFEQTDKTLTVYADESRAAPVIDPRGRWLRLSCGAAVYNALLTARANGHVGQLSLPDDATGSTLIGSIALAGRCAPTSDEIALAAALPERHTMRAPFDPRPVPDVLVDKLRDAAEAEGAWMYVLQRPEDVVELAVLTSRAEEAERANPAYRHELASWLRTSDTETDGIPTDALPDIASPPRGSDVPLREFRPPKGSADAVVEADSPPEAEHPLLVVIGTDRDHRSDWLHAGMAMQHLLLTATAHGLAASPMTQSLDQPESRAQLSHLVGIDRGHPQMVLRIGFGVAQAVTGRRPEAELAGTGRATR